MSFVERFVERARSRRRTVVFPEGEDPRILEAARRLADDGVAGTVLLGSRERVEAERAAQEADISKRIEALGKLRLVAREKADETGTLYGSVSAATVAKLLAEGGHEAQLDALTALIQPTIRLTATQLARRPEGWRRAGEEIDSSELIEAMEKALDALFADADAAIADGNNLLILSDRDADGDNAAIPALLAMAGLHHHLIREGTRTKVGIAVESGEPREVHHF